MLVAVDNAVRRCSHLRWGNILSQIFRIKQKRKMVRLKRSNMSVLKDVTMKFKDFEEAEVWVAILKTGVCFNSLNCRYDGFYYKNEVVIQNMDRDKLHVRLRGNKEVIVRFGSQTSKEEFYKQLVDTEKG